MSKPKNQHQEKNISTFTFDGDEITLDQDVIVDVNDIDDLLSINPSLVQILKGSWDKHKLKVRLNVIMR